MSNYKKDLQILVHRLLPSYLRKKADDNYLMEVVKLWLKYINKHFYNEFRNLRNSLDIDLTTEIIGDSQTVNLYEPKFYDGYDINIGDTVHGQVIYGGEYIDKPQGSIGTITDYYTIINDDGSKVSAIDIDLSFGDFFSLDRIVVKKPDNNNLFFESKISYVYDEKRDFYTNLFINQYGYNFKDILKSEIATTESKQLLVKYIKNINEKKGTELSFLKFFSSFKPKFFNDNISVRMITNLYYLDGELIEVTDHENIDNYILGLSVPENNDDYYEEGVKNDYLNMIPATFVYKLETNLDPDVFRTVLQNSIHPAGFKFIYEYLVAWNLTFNGSYMNYTTNHHEDFGTNNLDLGLTNHYGVL